MQPDSPRPVFFRRDSTSNLVPELVLVPTVISLNQYFILQMAILAVLAFSAFLKSYRSTPTAKNFTYLPAIALLVVVALTFRDGPYRLALSYILVFFILLILSSAITRQSAYDSLLAGIVIYLTVNIVGWAVGFKSPSYAVRLGGYETTSPFFNERIVFPFTSSVNDIPYVAAALFLSVVAMVKIRRRPRWYLWFGSAAGLFVLLAANNRTALLLVVLLGGGLLLAPTFTRAIGPSMAAAALLLPFYLSLVEPLLQDARFLPGASFLIREGDSESLGTLQGRQGIWSGILSFWIDHFPGISSAIVGYGYQGHMASGAYLFVPEAASGGFSLRSAIHAHSSVLQASLDTGIIGATIILGTATFLVYRYGRDPELLPMFAMATTIMLSGVAERALTPGSGFLTAFLFIYLASCTPDSPGKVSEPPLPERRHASRNTLPR